MKPIQYWNKAAHEFDSAASAYELGLEKQADRHMNKALAIMDYIGATALMMDAVLHVNFFWKVRGRRVESNDL